MSKTFIPDYGFICIGPDYIPTFKLFADESWRQVRKDGKPVKCLTSIQAVQAAKDHVTVILNPPLKSERAPAIVPDVLGANTRHVDRAAREAAGQISALGGVIVKGKVVRVERVA